MALAKGGVIISGDGGSLSFSTVAEMKAYVPIDGSICYVVANGCFYGYSSKNTESSTLGKWRKFTLTE